MSPLCGQTSEISLFFLSLIMYNGNIMSIDYTSIQLTPQQQAAIALHAELEGKQWADLLEERFPILHELGEEEINANLANCDEGMQDVRAGRTRSLEEAIYSIASDLGLDLEK